MLFVDSTRSLCQDSNCGLSVPFGRFSPHSAQTLYICRIPTGNGIYISMPDAQLSVLPYPVSCSLHFSPRKHPDVGKVHSLDSGEPKRRKISLQTPLYYHLSPLVSSRKVCIVEKRDHDVPNTMFNFLDRCTLPRLCNSVLQKRRRLSRLEVQSVRPSPSKLFLLRCKM